MNKQKSITITWHIEDVQSLDDSFTDEEAILVLERLLKNHDANVGINWDVIEFHMNDIIEERINY